MLVCDIVNWTYRLEHIFKFQLGIPLLKALVGFFYRLLSPGTKFAYLTLLYFQYDSLSV